MPPASLCLGSLQPRCRGTCWEQRRPRAQGRQGWQLGGFQMAVVCKGPTTVAHGPVWRNLRSPSLCHMPVLAPGTGGEGWTLLSTHNALGPGQGPGCTDMPAWSPNTQSWVGDEHHAVMGWAKWPAGALWGQEALEGEEVAHMGPFPTIF